jgi:hypothetical protein
MAPEQNPQPLPEWADPAVPDTGLDPQGLSRRGLLRRAGLFGAGFAASIAGSLLDAAPAVAQESGDHGTGGDDPNLVYLAGDHHVHSVFSQRREVHVLPAGPARRPVRPGLDGLHRARQLRARQRGRRAART